MTISLMEFTRRKRRYATALFLRMGVSLLVWWGLFLCIPEILGPSHLNQLAGMAILALVMTSCFFGLVWYILLQAEALQRKHGLLCPKCELPFEKQLAGIEYRGGKCAKCGYRIVDMPTRKLPWIRRVIPDRWPGTKRLVILTLVGLVLSTAAILLRIKSEHVTLFRGITVLAVMWLLGILFCLLARRTTRKLMQREGAANQEHAADSTSPEATKKLPGTDARNIGSTERLE